jgi:hypothetical protein
MKKKSTKRTEKSRKKEPIMINIAEPSEGGVVFTAVP